MAAAFAAAPILTGVLVASTAITVGVGVFTAVRSAQSAEAQEEAERMREEQLAIQGLQESNQILEDEIATLAQVNVGAAASGIDPFTGTPEAVKRRIRERADRQLNVARLNTAFGTNQSQLRQRQLRLQGQASLVQGVGGAIGGAAGGAQQISAIG